MAILAPKARATKRGRQAAPWQGPAVAQAQGQKVRRVEHAEALNVVRRDPVKGDVGPDRIVELFWIPPELVVLLSREQIKHLVHGRKFHPIWTAAHGRRLGRGASVIATPGA
jgi:hypothetical protein